MQYKVYVDGACSGNPGIGGWGVVVIENTKEKAFLNGGNVKTTNNQMELTANIKALEYFAKPSDISIFTDSKYVKDGIESWILKWKKNGWKTAVNKPVKNKELWIKLDQEMQRHNITWNWVKGHSGNKYNEKADNLARKFIEDNN